MMARPSSRLDEFGLIARHFAPLAAGQPGALGLTDDAAVLDIPAGRQLVVTTDAMVAGVHFPADETPSHIARKLLRVNLSDLAAMGAQPLGYTLATMLTPDMSEDWVAQFAAGLAADQTIFGIGLVGGDTVGTPGPATFSLTALGSVAASKALRRSGALPGDDIYVSGTIGDAMLGLAIVQERLDIPDPADNAWLVDRFRLPTPRLALGEALVGIVNAAADISDGLVADLGHICEASECGARLEIDAVPLSAPARRAVTDHQPMNLTLLTGGDDYELVFTAPAGARALLGDISAETGVALTCIGSIVESTDSAARVNVFDASGGRIDLGHGGYQHFQEGPQEDGQEG